MTKITNMAGEWRKADLLERRVDHPTGRELKQEYIRAGESAYTPDAGDILGAGYVSSYNSVNNRARYAYMSHFVRGRKIVEVGTGMGWHACVMLGYGAAAYKGIELVDLNVRRSNAMLEHNGHEGASVRQGDLFDLTPEDTSDHDLVVCCEVLEHIPHEVGGPEEALKVLADSLEEGQQLLFSVPVLNKLEKVWGHLAIFGVDRVADMCAKAGLVADRVDIVSGQWVFVHARRGETEDVEGIYRRAGTAAGSIDNTRVDVELAVGQKLRLDLGESGRGVRIEVEKRAEDGGNLFVQIGGREWRAWLPRGKERYTVVFREGGKGLKHKGDIGDGGGVATYWSDLPVKVTRIGAIQPRNAVGADRV